MSNNPAKRHGIALTAALSVLLLLAASEPDANDPLGLGWKQYPNSCGSIPNKFSELIQSFDVAVLVQKAAGKKNEQRESPNDEYVVLKVVKAENAGVAKGDTISVPGRRSAAADELLLLVGNAERKPPTKSVHWAGIVKVTSACCDYIVAAPDSSRPTAERMAYFIPHLESADPQIKQDAFFELNDISFDELLPLEKKLPTEHLRKWATDQKTPYSRADWYAFLLGLCGHKEDADLLKKVVGEPGKEFRWKLDGAMIGYLLVSGEKGLDHLEQSRLQARDVLFSERYAVMAATRFLWKYAPGKIRHERLQASMRLFLDYPDLADLAIFDLARMKDWSVQDRLMAMYGKGRRTDGRRIKRAIVWYMLTSAADQEDNRAAATAKHVEMGRTYLATLRKKDSKTVELTEKYFLPAKNGK